MGGGLAHQSKMSKELPAGLQQVPGASAGKLESSKFRSNKMLEVQLVFHKEQVCTCGQLEVQLSQQHGML